MQVTIENGYLTATIKERGAELVSLLNKPNNIEYMWGADPAFWGKSSPVLFPIVGALKDNHFIHNGKKYSLSRHGFARDMDFEVEAHAKDEATFLLKSSGETLEHYPFPFELRINYRLEEDFLFVTYEVQNTGEEDMFFSIGAHPAFKIPLVDGTSYSDYFLKFGAKENASRWSLTAEGLLSDEQTPVLKNTDRLDLSRELFYNDALVFDSLKSNSISLKCAKHGRGIDFHFKGFPYFGIWAAKDADFVCLEPWCGVADRESHDQQLPNKEGIEMIEPGETWAEGWKVKCY